MVTPDVLYFGCRGASPHDIGHLWTPALFMTVSKVSKVEGLPVALDPWLLDGRFPPGGLADRKDIYNTKQIEGAAALRHIEGWTVLAFWDRSADELGHSNSAFLIRGTVSFDEAVARARAAFPTIWARFTFEVKLAELARP